MQILIFNCGSSSLKYKIIAMPSGRQLAAGEAQRVGPPTAQPPCIISTCNGKTDKIEVNMPDHTAAFKEVMNILQQKHKLDIQAIGHRIVHGGNFFQKPVRVNKEVLPELYATQKLAPLHNPPAVKLINACLKLYPDLPQVMVFDTGYHSTIPAYASTYCLPADISQKLHIKKYGFHGTSHRYVISEAAEHLSIAVKKINAVSCHLGSGGASLCAVVNGQSIDNTMGFSPLPGLIMSTRCGDISAATVIHLLAEYNGNCPAVEKELNKKSGLLGLSGKSGDIRDIVTAEAKGTDEAANKAFRIYISRIKKYLGSYLAAVAALSGRPADAVIFTDTIGETVPQVRTAVISGMSHFGINIAYDLNNSINTLPADITASGSRIKILVIRTNEELAIARDVFKLLHRKPVSQE
ncbi:MAG TPA: acetate/propionate family kinase [Spirochaetota bacterium]|nr:acetate/propionate family kinase [Spirochaetota bacterium]